MIIKYTDNILDIKKYFHSDLLKYYYNLNNSDMLLQILSDEYQYLTLSLHSKFFRSFVENYTIPFTTKYNNIFKVKNNNIYINEYILLPVGKYYKFGINSAYYYYYLSIIDKFPQNSEVVVVQTLGPWEIDNNKLNLFFEIENLLIKNRNCKVKTVFLLISYGEVINYNKIVIDNNENKDYIIIDCNDYKNFDKIKQYIKNTTNVIIDCINLYSVQSCHNELSTLPLLMITCNELLKCLNLDGNFYLNIKSFFIYKPSIQLFYIISKYFNKFEILNNNIVYLHFGLFKFSNYNNNIKDLLDDIIIDYISKDKYLGQNFIPKEQVQLQNCIILEKNKNKPNLNILIKSIALENINNDFINIFIDAYKKYNIKLKKNYKRIDMIKKILENSDKLKIEKTINLILVNNISKCIEYCLNNNIELNDIYNNPKIPNYNDIINTFFPIKKGIDESKLDIALDSAFSISKYKDLHRLSKLIKNNTRSIEYIIDGTSNIGVGSIVFSEYFKHVYAIEYNKITCSKLRNNIKVYNLKNVTVLCDDVVKLMHDKKYFSSINYDKNKFCLFIDPPWNGFFYKIEKVNDLYLNDINILDIIKEINIKYIYIKVPHNYNFSKLYYYFYNVTIYRFNGYFIIFITK